MEMRRTRFEGSPGVTFFVRGWVSYYTVAQGGPESPAGYPRNGLNSLCLNPDPICFHLAYGLHFSGATTL